MRMSFLHVYGASVRTADREPLLIFIDGDHFSTLARVEKPCGRVRANFATFIAEK